ncbi:hypothetical protein [Chthonobacter albigriseus]|uniref:hypothetical protein n=1 Tax=Chthonobacter albigriseus TaxID=1683161 RepID=UPI0015EF1405|nr:hypothetical protein [Chthonobacter albigriseus]
MPLEVTPQLLRIISDLRGTNAEQIEICIAQAWQDHSRGHDLPLDPAFAAALRDAIQETVRDADGPYYSDDEVFGQLVTELDDVGSDAG